MNEIKIYTTMMNDDFKRDNNADNNRLISIIPQEIEAEIARIYMPLRNKVAGYIVKNGGVKQDAEDAFSEAILRFFERLELGKYEEQGKMEGYIFEIAKNKWREPKRRKPFFSLESDVKDDTHATTEAKQSFLERERSVNLVLESDEWRDSPCYVLIMNKFFTKEKKLKELAEIGGIKAATLRKRLFVCLEKLRPALKNQFPDVFSDWIIQTKNKKKNDD